MDAPPDLIAGYRRFRERTFAPQAERYRALARAQRPRTMVIGCADSRVDPAAIFSAAPGELFVLRNIAALVPPCEETGACHGTSAAIEFAVTSLHVERIVVLGHGRCGGIAAALEAPEQNLGGGFIGPWVALLAGPRDALREAKHLAPEARQTMLERDAIRLSLANLATFPFVAEAMADGRLTLHGAWFSIADAALLWLDRKTGAFEAVDAPPPSKPERR